jgi:hypothetical protein
MIHECAEIGVLYNEPERFGVRFHWVPRSLFDLIPGEMREITASNHPLWVKTMMLAGVPGKHVEMTMYCEEEPHPRPLSQRPAVPPSYDGHGKERGGEPLLRESESNVFAGEQGTT